MKKTILWVAILLLITIIAILINISNNKIKLNEIEKFNSEFESFKDKEIYGTDVYTIINKAIDNNEKYKIEKDENKNYIENDISSVKINLILLTKNEKEEIVEIERPMEALQKAGLAGFIQNFAGVKFKFENIEYNLSGRVSKITVKQLEV